MSQFLTHLLYSSFSASILIGAVLLIRQIVTKRAPRWIACVLWGMVGVRLLIPFSIESELSILPEIEISESESDTDFAGTGNISDGSFGDSITESAESVSDAEPLESKGEPSGETQSVPSDESEEISDEASDESSREESTPREETSEETSDESTVSVPVGVESETTSDTESVTGEHSDAESTEGDVSEDSQDGGVDVGKLAQGIWLCGAVALVLYAAVHYVLLWRRVAVFSVDHEGVRHCESIDTPFVLGFFRPHIYLPFGVSEEAQRFIVAHERAHISRFDHMTKIIAFAALALHWFNPFVWLAFVLFCRDIEYACDEKVVRTLGAEERKKYASALLEFAHR